MTISSVCKNVGEQELMHTAGSIKLCKCSKKKSWWLLHSATPLPDTNTREIKAYFHTETCIRMFGVALFT